MSFWDEHAKAEQERADQWLDVEPALCATCDEVRRGVLLGICTDCFREWQETRDGLHA